MLDKYTFLYRSFVCTVLSYWMETSFIFILIYWFYTQIQVYYKAVCVHVCSHSIIWNNVRTCHDTNPVLSYQVFCRLVSAVSTCTCSFNSVWYSSVRKESELKLTCWQHQRHIQVTDMLDKLKTEWSTLVKCCIMSYIKSEIMESYPL